MKFRCAKSKGPNLQARFQCTECAVWKVMPRPDSGFAPDVGPWFYCAKHLGKQDLAVFTVERI